MISSRDSTGDRLATSRPTQVLTQVQTWRLTSEKVCFCIINSRKIRSKLACRAFCVAVPGSSLLTAVALTEVISGYARLPWSHSGVPSTRRRCRLASMWTRNPDTMYQDLTRFQVTWWLKCTEEWAVTCWNAGTKYVPAFRSGFRGYSIHGVFGKLGATKNMEHAPKTTSGTAA